MLAWFSRQRAQRFGRFAELIRRHQLIALRPPPGAIMREALGLAPRLYTLTRFRAAFDPRSSGRAGAEPIRAPRLISPRLLTRRPEPLEREPAPAITAPGASIGSEAAPVPSALEPVGIDEHRELIAASVDEPISAPMAAEPGLEAGPDSMAAPEDVVAPMDPASGPTALPARTPPPASRLAPSERAPIPEETVELPAGKIPELPVAGRPARESVRPPAPPAPIRAARSESVDGGEPASPPPSPERSKRSPEGAAPAEPIQASPVASDPAALAPTELPIEPPLELSVPTAASSSPVPRIDSAPEAGTPSSVRSPQPEPGAPSAERESARTGSPPRETAAGKPSKPASPEPAPNAELRPVVGQEANAEPSPARPAPARREPVRSSEAVTESSIEPSVEAPASGAPPESPIMPPESAAPVESPPPEAERPVSPPRLEPEPTRAAVAAEPSSAAPVDQALEVAAESAAAMAQPAVAGPPVASAPEVPPPSAAPEPPPAPSGWTPNEERRARPPVRTPVRPTAEAGRPADPGQPSEPPRRDIEAILAQPDEAAAEPSVWLERLRRAFAPAGAAPAARPPVPAPEPMSLGNRELLTPLVGRDPGPVTVRRGGIVSKAVSRLDAEAVAVGEEILLAEGHPQSEPETTGLLAHELVHTARRRSPRFVPPIIGERARSLAVPHSFAPPLGTPGPAPSAAPGSAAGPVEPSVSAGPDDEEAVALRTEGAVRAFAERRRRGEMPTIPSRRDRTEAPAGSALGPGSPSARAAEPSPWGGLPAPWEPIPDFGVPAGRSREVVVAAPTGEGSTGGTVHRAATGRDAALPAPAEAPADGQHGAAPVDVDALAKQVYGILKRRLSDERRRAM